MMMATEEAAAAPAMKGQSNSAHMHIACELYMSSGVVEGRTRACELVGLLAVGGKGFIIGRENYHTTLLSWSRLHYCTYLRYLP